MSNEKYSNMDELPMLGFLVNALDKGKGNDGDTNASFPRSDAEDLSRGARFIPGEVTLARREGEKVNFVQECGPCCWYWEMPDGSRIYHFERFEYEKIARNNGYNGEKELAGPCPVCGNEHTHGGTIKKENFELLTKYNCV